MNNNALDVLSVLFNLIQNIGSRTKGLKKLYKIKMAKTKLLIKLYLPLLFLSVGYCYPPFFQ